MVSEGPKSVRNGISGTCQIVAKWHSEALRDRLSRLSLEGYEAIWSYLATMGPRGPMEAPLGDTL